jgi:hypothetical protein
MTRAPRLVLCLLLVLLQVLTPWVHAHTGKAAGGFLHLPGLEKLAAPAEGCGLDEARPEGSGVLIAVQSGCREAVCRIRLPAPALPLPAPPVFASARAAAAFRPDVYRGAPGASSAGRHDAPPRAPPGLVRLA